MRDEQRSKRMKELYDQGLTLRQIAARFGVSYETVRRHIAALEKNK